MARPGEVVYRDFILSDMPDSLPTIVIKQVASGVQSIISAGEGVLSQAGLYSPSGADYSAYATIPSYALNDYSYTGRVSATIDGVNVSAWLDFGTVNTDIDDLTTAIESLEADVEAVKAKTDSIGSISAVVPNAGITDGGVIRFIRGDSYEAEIVSDYDLSGVDKVWFTAKRSSFDPDSAAVMQIVYSGGLQVFNGATASGAGGELILASSGITMTIEEEYTAQLKPIDLLWDVQILRDGDVTTIRSGTATVTPDITREYL